LAAPDFPSGAIVNLIRVIETARIPMQRRKTLKVVAGIAASFIGLAGTVVFLSATEVMSFEMAKLMLVALLGLYVGFGFLFAVYRFIGKLE